MNLPETIGSPTVWTALNKNLFLVKEDKGATFEFKVIETYDMFDPVTNEHLFECCEPHLGFFAKFFRALPDYRVLAPFDIVVRLPKAGPQAIRIKRGIVFFGGGTVKIFDENNQLIGSFVKKGSFSIGSSFKVLNKDNQVICELKGDWKGRDFKFLFQGTELAQVCRKWEGLAKELFSSNKNYVISINESVPRDNNVRQLIIAAILCVEKLQRRR